MKWEDFATPQDKTIFVDGDWNVIDDRSGRKVKASETTKQWDGMRSTRSQRRHPQDFLRSTPERIRTPWNRPEVVEDTFVNQAAELTNGNFLSDTGWSKGSSWTIANGFASWVAGSTDTMYQSVNAVSGATYQVTYTLFNYVGAGSLTPSIGATAGTARSAPGTYTDNIVSAGANPSRLTFTPGAGGTSFDIDMVRVLRV